MNFMKIVYILILNTFIVAANKSLCEQRNHSFSKEIEFGKTVCFSCQPGQFVNQFCTTNNTNWCTTCPHGYYMKYWNLCRICHECTECTSELMLTEDIPCTPTSDRTCKCREGWFSKTKEKLECKPHRKCKPGQGVSKMGTSISNVQCSECPPGFFQSEFSGTARCVEHTVCPSSVLIPGDKTHDNICFGSNITTHNTRTPNYSALLVTTGISPSSNFDDDTRVSTGRLPTSDASHWKKTMYKSASFTGAEVYGTNNVSNDISLLWIYTSLAIFVGIALFTASGVLCYCYFKAPASQVIDTKICPVNQRRFKLKADVDIKEVYWFLAKKIPHQLKERFYHCLRLEQYLIDDVIYDATHESVTSEKYKILLQWQQTKGKLATLDVLMGIMDSLHLQHVKEQLISEFCQVSHENSTWV